MNTCPPENVDESNEDTDEEKEFPRIEHKPLIDMEEIQNAPRKPVAITLSEPLLRFLRELYQALHITKEDSDELIPFSWFIEDFIVWVLLDDERFVNFLKDMYVEVEEEENGKEKEDKSPKKAPKEEGRKKKKEKEAYRKT